MKTKILTAFVIAAAFLSQSGARAQNMTVSPNAPVAAPAPNQVIYSPRLPSAAELTSAAAAQGVSIDKIEQTGSQMTVIYKLANGQTNTVSYQLLPTANAAPSPVVTTSPPPAMYDTAPRVVYYEPADGYYPAYYSPYWYPPVSFHLGLGYGFRGGAFRGGFHHGR